MIGDITFDDKRESDETAEMEAIDNITKGMYGEKGNAVLLERINGALTDVLASSQRESKLGRAFNAVERLGCLRAGLRAWEESHKLGGD